MPGWHTVAPRRGKGVFGGEQQPWRPPALVSVAGALAVVLACSLIASMILQIADFGHTSTGGMRLQNHYRHVTAVP